MSRLPIIGGDANAWGTVLNDYLTTSADMAVLASSPTAGATTFDLAVVPGHLEIGSSVAIDAYTTQCEIRSVAGISGNTVTVDTALRFAHASNDVLLTITNNFVLASWFGLTGDGSDEWGPVQRMFREATLYGGMEIRGGSATYYIGQPLLVSSGSRIDRLTLQSRSGFSPVDNPAGSMVSVANQDSTFTATASDNTFTTPSAHGLVVSEIVAFNNPYGDTFPGGVTAGRWYYIKSVPSGTTFTVSATDGGATLDVTSDGAGWSVQQIGDLTRIFWESLRVILTVADLNGITVGPQQPSWTRNLRVSMEANATVSAYGFAVGGQLSYHDNVEIDTLQNCIGLFISGTGISIRGFNCNGVNNGDTGIVVTGGRHSLQDIWTEQCGRAGVEIRTSLKGLTIGGYWLQSSSSPTTAPVLLVTTSTSSYKWDAALRCASSSQLLLNDTARGITISGSTEMDTNLVFFGLLQQNGNVGPVLNHQAWAFISSSPYSAARIDRYIKADASGGSITVNLPTAVGWLGQLYTVKHSGSGNTVTIDPAGTETIDGSSTLVLTAKQAATVMSDGANWHIMDQKLAGSATTYTPTNVTTDRSFDADTVVITELADVVGTLIGDLQTRGILA